MRNMFLASAFAMAMLASPATAAPMSTSDLLKPESAVSQVYRKCHNVCRHWGHCGYGYGRHRCCKAWHRVCH